MSWLSRVFTTIGDELIRQIFGGKKASSRRTSSPPQPSSQPANNGSYPGDFHGTPNIFYAPEPGTTPDPGEIVWTWVPYEEDHSQGKDRPVLLIGQDGPWLLGLQLTSQDHDRDAEQEERAGRRWVDIGSGAWDPQRRPSEVRINRFIRVDPTQVRRIGAVLNKERFDAVAAAIRAQR